MRGRKVIVTPGLVESTLEANITFAKAVNEVFDFVIITGALNEKVLREHIDINKTLYLVDKSQWKRYWLKKHEQGI